MVKVVVLDIRSFFRSQVSVEGILRNVNKPVLTLRTIQLSGVVY
jgi:hypothetical protein